MAPRDQTARSGPRLTALSQLPDYEIADNTPDVRGWAVTTTDGGTVGRIEDLLVDTGRLDARYLIVRLGGARTTSDADESQGAVLVPVERAHLEERAQHVRLDVTPVALAALPRYTDAVEHDEVSRAWAERAPTPGREDTRVLTRSAEELHIGKRTVPVGEVRVSKHVEREQVSEPVSRVREEVEVERRPVSDRDAVSASLRDDEIRIPVSEEEIVVEKRPVVKEEIVVKKHAVRETKDVAADLRKERVDVDRVEPRGEDAARGRQRRARDKEV